MLIIIMVSINTETSYAQDADLLASCSTHEGGRCTGSSYCRACRNCSRCGHCSRGGTCGVCSGGYRSTRKAKSTSYSSTSSSYTNSSTGLTSSSSNTINSTIGSSTSYADTKANKKYYSKTLIVNSKSLNLRNGPGAIYPVIEKLKKDQKLDFLEMTGNWVKVVVRETKTIGYVNYRYLLVEE